MLRYDTYLGIFYTLMFIEFSKMHGLGNDFVVIDCVTQHVSLAPEFIKFLADRHVGIGFDQLLVVEPPSRPDVDFRYRIFNADGNEVEQCGNGARCFARFVVERKLSFKNHFVVETAKGIITLDIDRFGWVKVDMGEPRFEPADIPFSPDASQNEGEPDDRGCYVLEVAGETYKFFVVNVGNPHAVILVDDVLAADVANLGKAFESHTAFANRVNVGFMQVVDDKHIKLRVFERGVGETHACGTGACAAVVAGISMGLLTEAEDIRAQLYGGSLVVNWAEGSNITMIGPTATVFTGGFHLESLLKDAGLNG